jgi:uncharacterized protein
MQGEERDLIAGLFNRLKAYEAQPRDPEAEQMISTLVSGQPAAPYLLTQTVLVQEQALKAAQQRIAELEAKTAASPPPSGFLSSAPRIGPWGAAPAAPAAPQGAIPAQQQQVRSPLQAALAPQAAAPSAGGGFLRSALATAAGVAGGALLFDGIRNLLGHSGGPFATQGYLDPGAAMVSQDTPLMPPDQMPDQLASTDASPYDSASQYDNTSDDYDVATDDAGSDSSFGDDSDFA